MDHSVLNNLYSNFSNPNSISFASVDIEQILRDSNSDASQHPVTRDDIKRFQLSLESISRQRERRILKGRKRKASFRKWVVYSPRHLILGDLAFLRKLDSTNNSHTIIAVFMDAHSRSTSHPFSLFPHYTLPIDWFLYTPLIGLSIFLLNGPKPVMPPSTRLKRPLNFLHHKDTPIPTGCSILTKVENSEGTFLGTSPGIRPSTLGFFGY